MHPFAYFTMACFFFSSVAVATGEFDAAVKADLHHYYGSPPPPQQHQEVQNMDDNSTKLFVFGDSYADTGNWPKSTAISWKKPYGITFPGRPSGRFSDGLIITDYIASTLGISSPIPYNMWKVVGDQKSEQQDGINFAHGGTGVFTTLVNQPNMTTQINLFQQLVDEDQVYGTDIPGSWLALVSVAGNDYAAFLAKHGTYEELPGFTDSIMSQLELNLRRIHGLGVQKICITSMPPLGCLPQMTFANSHVNCTETGNSLATHHNQMLQETVQKLNNETDGSVFMILDLYTSFMSALNIDNNHPGDSAFAYQLRPCCFGLGEGHSCGSINDFGMKKYFVCEDPMLSFFWDFIHPSQQGWKAVYSALEPNLQNFLN